MTTPWRDSSADCADQCRTQPLLQSLEGSRVQQESNPRGNCRFKPSTRGFPQMFPAKEQNEAPCPAHLFLKLMFSGLNTSWYAALLPRMRSSRWTASTTALQGNTHRAVAESSYPGLSHEIRGSAHNTVNSSISELHYATAPLISFLCSALKSFWKEKAELHTL